MGDADLVREVAEVRDVLLAPVGGGSVMTPEEAADAVMLLRPKTAVPIHYTDKKPSSSETRRIHTPTS